MQGLTLRTDGWKAPPASLRRSSGPSPADEVLFGAKPLRERAEQHYPVVIVGGGVAGLTAQYELTKRGIQTLLLEAGPRAGGNSGSAEAPNGIRHTVGATILSPGNAEQRRLWKALDLPLKPAFRLKPEIFALPSGERFTAFGAPGEQIEPSGPHAREAAKAIRSLLKDIRKIVRRKHGATTPLEEASDKALSCWDGMPFSKFLKPYGKAARTLIEPFVQSDLGAKSEALSAYPALIDLDDLNDRRYVLPGGNGFITERLAEAIRKRAPLMQERVEPPIRLRSKVEWIEQEKDRAFIQYRDPQNRLRTISAGAVLMALPYTKVPCVMDLPKGTRKFLRTLPKNSYSLVNVYLNKTPLEPKRFYILAKSRKVSDLYLTNRSANEGKPSSPDEPSVLNVYAPHKGRVRDQNRFRRELLEEIRKYLPEVKPEMVEGLRVNPFYQAMISLAPGQVRQMAKLPKTYGRVTLIHSDGGAAPSILEAVSEAQRGVKVALKQLGY